VYQYNKENFETLPNKAIIDCICNNCNTIIKRSVLFIKHDLRHGVENVPCPKCRKSKLLSKNTKNCKQCRVKFYHNTNIFCTQKCAAIFNNKNKLKKIKQNYISRKCKRCGNDILNKRKSAVYCSLNCSRIYKKEQLILKKDLLIENNQPTATKLESNSFNCKSYLIRKFGKKCMRCGWAEVNPTSGRVPIELEHKDGNCTNNNLENLELLCPNCHSLSPYYKGANKRKGHKSPRYEAWKQYFQK